VVLSPDGISYIILLTKTCPEYTFYVILTPEGISYIILLTITCPEYTFYVVLSPDVISYIILLPDKAYNMPRIHLLRGIEA
jgi:hypothetical protein